MGKVRRRLRTRARSCGFHRRRTNDLSGWVDLGLEVGGARKKNVISRPGGQQIYLVKFPQYGDFEISTEIFNSILANELGIRHVQYFPARFNRKRGVICASFVRDGRSERVRDLWEMKEILCRATGLDKDLHGRDREVLREHHIEQILYLLECEFGEDVLPDFFSMVGFDALVGHGDRHWSNYGVVLEASGNDLREFFSPIYDTASGYLTEIQDARRLRTYLESTLGSVDWYRPSGKKAKGLCKITVSGEPKTNHFDLLSWIITSRYAEYRRYIERPFRAFSDELPEMILDRFFPALPKIRREVIRTILTMRAAIGRQVLGL